MPSDKDQLILALDIGTSSVRAALYDQAGNVLPKTMVKNERTLIATGDGGAEIDADKAYGQLTEAIDDVLSKAAKVKGDIVCVAASAFWHSLVGADKAGRPTTKVFGWADTRSRDAVEILRRRLNETEVHNRTGARFHSSFWPAKLHWLRKTSPLVFRRTARWLSFSDYAGLRLFGEPLSSVSMASATGLFDIRRCAWDTELLSFLKLSARQLPPIAATSSAGQKLDRRFSRRWPRLKDALWLPAIGDGAANNIGAGCMNGTKAALMIGTSGAMRLAYTGEPPASIPPGLWCYRIDRRRVITGGALSDGGGLFRWLTDRLKFGLARDKIEAEIRNRGADAHGIDFLPFVAGERSTGYHESARGAVVGLRTATDSIDILQAALESVAYRFAEMFDQLNRVKRVKTIIASGGALRESPLWTQMIADVLGRDLVLPDTREASSRGAVLLALESIGKIRDIDKLGTPAGQKFEFHKACNQVYKKARKRHEELYAAQFEKRP